MGKKASEILGEPVIAGVQLEAKASIRNVVGGTVGEAMTGFDLKPTTNPGGHNGIHYVAVGPTKVGFFSMKRGIFKPSLGELLAEHARSDVKAVEIESGMMPKAHFVFRDGTNYVLMCARINRGKLKKVQKALAAH